MRAIFLTCCIAFLLCACVSNPAMQQKESAEHACKIACEHQLIRCEHLCEDNCCQCRFNSQQETLLAYNQYRHEQHVQGKDVALELQSFRDPLQCTKKTCECQADYRVCIQACEGKIRKRMQIVGPCDQLIPQWILSPLEGLWN